MSTPDDVTAAADHAARLHDLTEQYRRALSRYEAVPKTDNAFAAAVDEEHARRDDAAATEIREALDYDRRFARESVETLAAELRDAAPAALSAIQRMYEQDWLGGGTEHYRVTAFEDYDPDAAARQVLDDLETLAEMDAETVPQIGVHTGANLLVDGPTVPNPDTPAGEAAAADRAYLDLTPAEQEAEYLRQFMEQGGTDDRPVMGPDS